jgi:hypothetical protein
LLTELKRAELEFNNFYNTARSFKIHGLAESETSKEKLLPFASGWGRGDGQ